MYQKYFRCNVLRFTFINAHPAISRGMGGIFIDREKLSSRHVPGRLPHRDYQLSILRKFIFDVLESDATTLRTVMLVGPTGTGKTSSIILLHRSLMAEEREHAFVHVNMRIEGETPFQLFSAMYEKLTGMPASRSISGQELLKEVTNVLRRSGLPAILAFDEIEFHARSSLRSVLYALLRLNEVTSKLVPMAIVFVARGLDWLKLLEPAERSSLGNLIVRYPPYSREQLFDILSFRASEAFASGVIGDDVLKWLADYTYTYMSGDVRRALDTLLYAGVLAEQEGAGKVTLRHVLDALRNVEAFIAPADIGSLTVREKLLLYAALQLVKARPYARLSELWEEYTALAESYGLDAGSLESFEDMVQRLIDLGALMAEGPARVAPTPSLNLEVLKEALRDIERGLAITGRI